MVALVREAGIIALKEGITCGSANASLVTMKHFQDAIERIRPSVPEKDRKVYQRLKETYGKTSPC